MIRRCGGFSARQSAGPIPNSVASGPPRYDVDELGSGVVDLFASPILKVRKPDAYYADQGGEALGGTLGEKAGQQNAENLVGPCRPRGRCGRSSTWIPHCSAGGR